MIRFATYNTLDLFLSHDRADLDRYQRVLQVIRELKVDILAIQGLRAHWRLAELADAAGMTAFHEPPWISEDDAEDGKPALGTGSHGCHVALIWNPDTVSPVRDTFHSVDQGDVFHGLIKGQFEVPGSDGGIYRVQHASFQAGPFGNFGQRAGECERVVSAMTLPDDRPPGLVGADWNTIGADRCVNGEFYDPDPYAGRLWHPALVYQCTWSYDERGDRTDWRANRQPGDVLYAGELYDAAVALHNRTHDRGGVAWQATVGHWPQNDPFGARRVDGVRVTAEVQPALRNHEVITTELALSASAHLPVVVTYDPAAIDYPHHRAE